MKKILFWCMIFLSIGINAQILVNESFEGTTTPTGFAYTSFSRTTISPRFCTGAAALSRNFWSSGTTGNIVYSSTASNATAMDVEFKYKTLEYSAGSQVGGDFKVEYSVDNGTTYTQLGSTITVNTVVDCTTWTNTIPAGTIPNGASFKFRISGTRTAGDYYFIIDDVKLTQTVTSAPTCTTVTAPVNAATGVSVTPTITYGASVGTSSYLINLGTTSGGTNALNAYNNGTNTSYTIPTASALLYSTTYYVSVNPSNSLGTATGCAETTFTTLNIPCPTVSQPAASATGLSVQPTFSWTAVTGASGYYLSVGTTAGGTDILNNQDVGNVTSYTLTSPLNVSTQYFYTLKAYQGSNVSSSCTERTFTTGSALPPANDNCNEAISLTVNPDLACGSVTAGNTLGATQSMAAAPCSGGPNDDVWYSFVATSTSHVVTLSNIVSTGTTTGITDMYFQVLSGSCGSQTSLLCSDPNSGTVTNLTVGDKYYVRVYTWSSTATANASFNICVGTLPPPPANDDCANAVSLPVSSTLTCGTPTAGNTTSATNSGIAVSPCTGTADDDVWYSFVATSTSHVIALSNVVSTGTSSSTSLYTQVFSGACGTLASVVCGTTTSTTATGLNVGDTYYVRVYNSNGAGFSNSFNICILTPPPPPANDICSGAISLTPGATFDQNAITTSNYSATNDGTAPSCQSSWTKNVWYTVTVPASGSITIETKAPTTTPALTDTVMQVYTSATNSCGDLTQLACDDDNGDGNFSKISLTGQVAGSTIYINVSSWGSASVTEGDFKISAYDGSLATSDVNVKDNKIKVYPNPFTDIINITDARNVKAITVVDASGRIVKKIANPTSEVNLAELKSGLYIIKIDRIDGSSTSEKVIKK